MKQIRVRIPDDLVQWKKYFHRGVAATYATMFISGLKEPEPVPKTAKQFRFTLNEKETAQFEEIQEFYGFSDSALVRIMLENMRDFMAIWNGEVLVQKTAPPNEAAAAHRPRADDTQPPGDSAEAAPGASPPLSQIQDE